MLEILTFVFSSFWIWLGSFLMLGVAAAALRGFVSININTGEKNDP